MSLRNLIWIARRFSDLQQACPFMISLENNIQKRIVPRGYFLCDPTQCGLRRKPDCVVLGRRQKCLPDQTQKGGFSCPVSSNQSHFPACRYLGTGALKKLSGVNPVFKIFYGQHDIGVVSSGTLRSTFS